jgi:DNA-binding protein H-NS
MDLSEMTYPELEKHQKDVEAAMRNLDKTRKSDAKKAVRKTAKDHGFTVEELFDLPAKKSTAAASPPKYRNPKNPDETWTGKGRKPKWLAAALEDGADLSSFEI